MDLEQLMNWEGVSEDHRARLEWFYQNAGTVHPFAELAQDEESGGRRLTSKAKGIYKPSGTNYVLSIRQTLNSPYADSPQPSDLDGPWRYEYHQEEPKGVANPETYWTNLGLVASMKAGLPVGVLIQLTPKPNPQYRVLGLAHVRDYRDGVFYLEGIPRATPQNSASDNSTIKRDAPTTDRSVGPRFWAFVANPTMYDIERAITELTYDTWTTKGSHVRAGDKALIWKSLGRSTERGVIAFADILSDPSPDIPDDSNLWLGDNHARDEPRVAIQYVVPPNGPVWANPATEPVLSQLSVWRGQGTVFRVTPEQWDSIVELAGGWPDVIADTIEREALRMEEQGVFDPTSVVDGRERVTRDIVRRQGQPAFRAKLIEAYGGRCAITGCDVVQVLEAAHIVPYQGAETNHVTNGLLLRSDIHMLFDLGLIAVDEEAMCILVAPELSTGEYAELSGSRLTLPRSLLHHPNRDALRQHRARTIL